MQTRFRPDPYISRVICKECLREPQWKMGADAAGIRPHLRDPERVLMALYPTGIFCPLICRIVAISCVDRIIGDRRSGTRVNGAAQAQQG
jgi:hypothetical protein